MRFADLPPADQRAIRSGRVDVPVPARPSRVRQRPAPGTAVWRCGLDGHEFTAWAAAERHADQDHPGVAVRLELIPGG